eukprot:7010825-Alexandrium_andersonii.AAC.1
MSNSPQLQCHHRLAPRPHSTAFDRVHMGTHSHDCFECASHPTCMCTSTLSDPSLRDCAMHSQPSPKCQSATVGAQI